MISAGKDEVANQPCASDSQGSSCLCTGSAEDSYGDYILLLVSDPAERRKSSIIRTRLNMIGTRPQSRVMLCSMLVSPLFFQWPAFDASKKSGVLQSNKCRVELSNLRAASPDRPDLTRSPLGFVAVTVPCAE